MTGAGTGSGYRLGVTRLNADGLLDTSLDGDDIALGALRIER